MKRSQDSVFLDMLPIINFRRIDMLYLYLNLLSPFTPCPALLCLHTQSFGQNLGTVLSLHYLYTKFMQRFQVSMKRYSILVLPTAAQG